jgi:8-oxo-dGTP pyrophosphatase MutT (NUDIX family)
MTSGEAVHRPPGWLTHLAVRSKSVPQEWISQLMPPEGGGLRSSAVLMLFGPAQEDPARTSLVLTERAHTMRSHPGQVSFPGGGREERDADLVATALREAEEEIGLDPSGVEVLGSLPTLHLSVSDYDVCPVLGWWRDPSRVWARDVAEVARVIHAPVDHLVDPAHRFRVRHPLGYIGPAFEVDGALVWGFTGMLLDRTLRLAGIDRPWDPAVVRDLPTG